MFIHDYLLDCEIPKVRILALINKINVFLTFNSNIYFCTKSNNYIIKYLIRIQYFKQILNFYIYFTLPLSISLKSLKTKTYFRYL